MQYFDIGGQHFIYADTKGNIAYFTNAEVPIREELQAGTVRGNPIDTRRCGERPTRTRPAARPSHRAPAEEPTGSAHW
jgi:penicillin amidase